MKIYHYTTIETLALILKYGTIRFNRLDRVDDLEESEYGVSRGNIKLGQYHFVSCWTKEDEENIGLWGLYTRYKGVRIGLDADMFITYPINGDNDYESFYSDFECGHDYVISQTDSISKPVDVKYEKDLKEKISELGVMLEENPDGRIPFMRSPLIGTYKREHWSFQKECRFKIFATPVIPGLVNKPQDWYKNHEEIYSTTGDLMCDGVPISLEFIDINLKDKSLLNMDVLLGPLTSDADKIIVESLKREFGLVNEITNSYFKGKIREKKI